MKNHLPKMGKRLFSVLVSLLALIAINTNLSAQVINESFEETAWTAATATSGTVNLSATTALTLSVYSSYGVSSTSSCTVANNSGNWLYSGATYSTSGSGLKGCRSIKSSMKLNSSKSYIITPILPTGVGQATFWVAGGGVLGAGLLTGTNTTTACPALSSSTIPNLTLTQPFTASVITGTGTASTSLMHQVTYTYSNSNPCQFVVFVGSGSTMYLDDIVITGATVTPQAPIVNNMTIDGNSATISGTAIAMNFPYTSYTVGQTLSASTIVATTDSASVTTQVLNGSTDITSSTFNIGDVLTYVVTKNSLSTTYTITTSASVPAPAITLLTANASQTAKAQVSITPIKFKLTNATGATVTGLPSTMSYVVNSTKDTLTISGAPGVESSYPQAYTYTVEATPLGGYTGSTVSTTGNITVRDPNGKSIAYVVGTRVSTNDTQIYPALKGIYSVDTILIANVSATTNFSAYDLVVLTELPSTGSTGMKALWGIDKPLLNIKAFATQANTWAFTGVSAASNAAGSTTIKIAHKDHPIFNGLSSISGDSLVVLANLTSSTTNSLQGNTFANAYNLATISGKSIVNIQEIPVGASPNGTASKAKYLQIGVADASTGKYTADGIQLVKNACEYLMSSTAYVSKIASISAITVGGVAGTIDQTAGTIAVTLPSGTDVTGLVIVPTNTYRATITVPASLTSVDCTNPQTITVLAEDGVTSKSYTLTVTVSPVTGIKEVVKLSKVYSRSSSIIVDAELGAKVSVSKISGEVIYSKELKSSPMELPVSKGAYVVSVNGKSEVVIVK